MSGVVLPASRAVIIAGNGVRGSSELIGDLYELRTWPGDDCYYDVVGGRRRYFWFIKCLAIGAGNADSRKIRFF